MMFNPFMMILSVNLIPGCVGVMQKVCDTVSSKPLFQSHTNDLYGELLMYYF